MMNHNAHKIYSLEYKIIIFILNYLYTTIVYHFIQLSLIKKIKKSPIFIIGYFFRVLIKQPLIIYQHDPSQRNTYHFPIISYKLILIKTRTQFLQ